MKVVFERHLQRSKEAPLTCTLKDLHPDYAVYFPPVFFRLLQESRRWEHIVVKGHSHSIMSIPASERDTMFPILRSITVVDWTGDTRSFLAPVLSHSPNLRHLVLRVGYLFNCLKCIPKHQLSQLVTLKIWNLSNNVEGRAPSVLERDPQLLLSILAQCTSLECLEIGTHLYSIITFSPDEFTNLRPVVLPALRYFSFPISDADFPMPYLRLLTFPNLSELVIAPTYRLALDFRYHKDYVMDFVQRHGKFGTVRKLTLGLNTAPHTDYRFDVLDHFPNIVELDLAEPRADSDPGTGFADGDTRLAFKKWDEINSTRFATAIEHRWGSSVSVSQPDRKGGECQSLRVLRMGIDSFASLNSVNPEAFGMIMRCVERGMVLETVRARQW